MPDIPPPLLRAAGLFYHRAASPEVTLDLRAATLDFTPRSFTLISGSAGSGAGMLLRMLGLLDRPQGGEVFVAGEAAGPLDDAARLELRNRAFGFVFAEPFLLESFTVAENIAMPLFKISCLDLEKARQRTAELLAFVNLSDAADHPVRDLNLLAQHQLALARALANAPEILIAEDAGVHLAATERAEFFRSLRKVKDAHGLAVIAHSSSELEETGADREWRVCGGRLSAAAQEEARANE